MGHGITDRSTVLSARSLPPRSPVSPDTPMFPLGLVWAACRSTPVEPEVSLDAAALEVLTTLDLAVDRAAQGDRGAAEAWTAAHDRFQVTLEPALRERVGAEEMLAIEYTFGRVRSAIAHGESAAVEVDLLSRRLEEAARDPMVVAHR